MSSIENQHDNYAAWLIEPGQPLSVRPAPTPAPEPDEVLIHVRAIAFNPVDWFIQIMNPPVFPGLTFPSIGGEDVAGEVVAVGSDIKSYQIGDRVAGQSASAFQTYALIKENVMTKIPTSMSFTDAAVIPLCFSTAAVGLFSTDGLELPLPKLEPVKNGLTVLIWGASTSVGCNAVQLAVASGCDVIATASPKNFDKAKALGAKEVYDYNSPTIQKDLIEAFRGKKCGGALAIAGITPEGRKQVEETCIEVVASVEGVKKVALTMPPSSSSSTGTSKTNEVTANFTRADVFRGLRDLGLGTYAGYLTEALETGKFVPAPKAEVVGHGLDAVQVGLDRLRLGDSDGPISAKKIVITL